MTEERFSFSKAHKRYKEARKTLFHTLYAHEMTDLIFGDLVERAVRLIKWAPDDEPLDGFEEVAGPKNRVAVVAQSLTCIYGKVLEDEVYEVLLWRVAGGHELMSRGQILEKECTFPSPEVVPLIVVSVTDAQHSREGKAMLNMVLRVVGGPRAGLAFTQRLPNKYVRHKLAPELGFPKFKPPHPRELVQCAVLAKVGMRGYGGTPAMEEFEESSLALAHNQRLRKRRRKCPVYGFSWTCQDCTLGYAGPEKCDQATHPRTYEKKYCVRCHRESWFDPDRRRKVCMICDERQSRLRSRL